MRRFEEAAIRFRRRAPGLERGGVQSGGLHLPAHPRARSTVHYLDFELSDDADGITTLQAVAATAADRHAAVLAEAQQVLDWAWRRFPNGHGPIDEGHDWDHDLQVTTEGGRWHVVTLTLAASPRFAEAFVQMFGHHDV
jgi:hypothetical protein